MAGTADRVRREPTPIALSGCCHKYGMPIPYCHMKTTVEIPDPLLRRLRRRAAEEGTSLRSLIELAIRQLLDPSGRSRPFRLKDRSVDGKGLAPGLREGDWSQVRDLIYEERGG